MGKKGGGRNAFVKNSLVSREDAIGPAEGVKTEAEAPTADTNVEAAAPDAQPTSIAGQSWFPHVSEMQPVHMDNTFLLKHIRMTLQAMVRRAVQELGLHNQLPIWLQLHWNMMTMRLRVRLPSGTRRSAHFWCMTARPYTPDIITKSKHACLPVQELKFHKEAMKKLGKKRKVQHQST